MLECLANVTVMARVSEEFSVSPRTVWVDIQRINRAWERDGQALAVHRRARAIRRVRRMSEEARRKGNFLACARLEELAMRAEGTFASPEVAPAEEGFTTFAELARSAATAAASRGEQLRRLEPSEVFLDPKMGRNGPGEWTPSEQKAALPEGNGHPTTDCPSLRRQGEERHEH